MAIKQTVWFGRIHRMDVDDEVEPLRLVVMLADLLGIILTGVSAIIFLPFARFRMSFTKRENRR